MRSIISIATLLFGMTYAVSAYGQNGVCQTADDVSALPAGHWCEVPNSNLRSAEKGPSEFDDWDGANSQKYSSFQRNLGVAAVTLAWNSAAYDSKRNCLILTGGGHNDYGGNEVYKFCLQSLQWSRVTDPTTFPARNPAYQNADGTPVSRHTFGGLAYLPIQDRFFVFDGAPDSAPGGCGMTGTWTLDLAERDAAGSYSPDQWELRTTANEPAHACGNAGAYDPVSGNVILKSASATHTYNFNRNNWSQVSSSGRRNDYISLAIDPGRRMLVEVGDGITALWAIDDGFSGGAVATSGASNIQAASNPGLAYDRTSDQIVGWAGGTVVYTFDIDRRTWTAVAPMDSNVIDPGRVTTAGGAFGRFNYSPAFNVFMYVDTVDGNVFLYRLGESKPLVVPRPPADLTTD